MNIHLQPEASCAAWLPQAAPPASLVPPGTWTDLFTDASGDVAALEVVEGPRGAVTHVHIFPANGGASQGSPGFLSDMVAMPGGFLYAMTESGPCMVCGTTLLSWPGAGRLDVGDGYPWHGSCSYAPRPMGGIYASCEGPYPVTGGVGPLTLEQRDEALNVTSVTAGIKPNIAAVDRLDRLLESGALGVRWLDGHGDPLTGFFAAKADGAFPLIGGGLLTTDDRVIASGESRVEPAADWLHGRAGSAFVVLGARAYALTDASCAAQIYSAGGELCGTLTFPGCTAPPRFGPDGSAIVSLDGGGWELWMRLLR